MNKNNYRTCVGGILILAGTIARILFSLLTSLIMLVTMKDNPYFDSAVHIQGMLMTAGSSFLHALPVIALSIVLMIKCTGIPVVVCSGLAALEKLLTIIISSINAKTLGYELNQAENCCILAVYVLMTVVAIIPLIPRMKNLKSLWFLPGAAYSLTSVIYMIQTIKGALAQSSVSLTSGYGIGFIIGTILGAIIFLAPTYGLPTAGFFLAGKWIVNPYKKGYQPQSQQAQYQQYQQYQQPAQPQYDEQTMQALNYYKWQYESGAITWEQYNAAIQPYIQK